MGPFRRAFDWLFWRLSHLLTPGIVNAQHRYIETLEQSVGADTVWLDLGCGHQLVPEWFKNASFRERAIVARAKRVVGVDLDLPAMARHRTIEERAMGRVESLPFADNTFDLVTANMVMEHLEDPANALTELRRVLKPGGRLIFHTPNFNNPAIRLANGVSQGLKHKLVKFFENREEDDVFPTHYRLNRRPQIKAFAEEVGLEVAQIAMVESSPVTVMLGPLVAVEMLFIRATRTQRLAVLRSNMIATLTKPTGDAAASRLGHAA